MEQSKEEILRNICELPSRFKVENKSFYDLVIDIDWKAKKSGVNNNDLENYLSKKPKLIEDWLIYSDDKRSSEGWYVKQKESGEYLVGYYDVRGTTTKEKIYKNAASACAHFIVSELDSIVSH